MCIANSKSAEDSFAIDFTLLVGCHDAEWLFLLLTGVGKMIMFPISNKYWKSTTATGIIVASHLACSSMKPNPISRLSGQQISSQPEMTLHNMVRGVQYFPCEAEVSTDSGVDMAIYVDVSGAVEVFDTQVVYTEGITSASAFSPALMKHRHEQIEEFLQRFGLIGKKVLEVGSGDGHVMAIITELGSHAFGIEPSSKMAEMSAAKGLSIIHGFMTQSNHISEGPFDAFVSFHVMEHIPDLGDFVRGIRENLVPGGVGMIEVPSLEQILEGNLFYEFFPDHLNYFTLRTLRLTLEVHGFEVIETRRTLNGAHNVAFVRRLEALSLASVKRSVKETITAVNQLVYKNVDQGRRVALWGASCQALVLLSQSESLPITYIVDRAPFKQGLFTPVTHLPIVALGMLMIDPVDTLLIIAPSYEQEILKDIQELGYCGAVFTLRDSNIVELMPNCPNPFVETPERLPAG